MFIKKVKIKNFKCFKNTFEFEMNKGLNILVGDNEAGKSTIIEAIHLCLTGMLNGRYLRNEINQYIFNNEIVDEYVSNIRKAGDVPMQPEIHIELFLEGDNLAIYEGDNNSEKRNCCGLSMKIFFDDKYKPEYEQLIANDNIGTIPIEYYDVAWTTFARDSITTKSIPIKSALIDSSSHRYQNGSDIYISRIIKENLDAKEIIDISQAYRKMREIFMEEDAIKNINTKIKSTSKISSKDVKLSVDLSSKNAWESSLLTYLDDIPFHQIGKGEQCIIKTKLALGHKKSKEANLILLEEPENHLSHSKLNQLISDIHENCYDKQILVSTHSSFVANKLGLDSLIILENKRTIKLKHLSNNTESFFKKLSGYDTLRLVLCKKAILVEGDSDELIVQKAYLDKHGKLPIEKGIDVISVGTSFLRFLEVAEQINKEVCVVTDNDGDLGSLKIKYANYIEDHLNTNITICFDDVVDTGNLMIGEKNFNYNTLEPKIVKANNLDVMNKVLGLNYDTLDDLHKYMRANKTECALKIFDTKEIIKFPEYILTAINE